MSKSQIVILGGGFAGISAAWEFERLNKSNESLDIHLVNNENYFVFQPMLPEVVSCGIEPSHILNPIRQLCPRVIFHHASVTKIDRGNQRVSLAGIGARYARDLPYDHLVLCLGLTTKASAFPGMAEHTLPLKTMGDAFHLRNHVVGKLEEAESEPDAGERKRKLTFITIGGGFSGVETMAALNDMVKAVSEYYPKARETGWRMVLVHSKDRILQELDDKLAAFAQRILQERGIELVLNSKIREATPSNVILSDGAVLPTETVICTVGNAPHALLTGLNLPQKQGRILVNPHLLVQDATNVWALGDAALVPDLEHDGYCPPTAQYATRQGKKCAQNIWAAIHGTTPSPFKFGGLGQIALVGRHCGVAKIFGFRMSGFLAWFLWRSVYLMKLPGLRCKVRVAMDWLLDVIFPRDITKIEVRRTEQLKHAHYQEGEIIFRQGEIGSTFYIIKSGEVEIIRQEPGKPDEQLAVRAAGDSFGELALLKNAPRAATVRCLTPVNVVMFTRQDFQSLVGSYDTFRNQMDKELTALSQFWTERDNRQKQDT